MAVLALKPRDVVVALKLVSIGSRRWSFASLAAELGMAPSQVHGSYRRLVSSRLVNPVLRRVQRPLLLGFLRYGVPFAFPAAPGRTVAGVPTAWAAEPVSDHLNLGDAPEDLAVWPHRGGPMRGRAIEPLHPAVPAAAAQDRDLYELLVLADALRVGRARERAIAADELGKRLA